MRAAALGAASSTGTGVREATLGWSPRSPQPATSSRCAAQPRQFFKYRQASRNPRGQGTRIGARLPASWRPEPAIKPSRRRKHVTRSLDERQEPADGRPPSQPRPPPARGASGDQEEAPAFDDSWWWRDRSKTPEVEAVSPPEEEREEEGSGGSLFSAENLAPVRVVSYAVPVALGLTLLSLLAPHVALNPWLWTYASWFFVLWPLPAAIGLGAWTLKIVLRRGQKKAAQWEQLVLLAGALTWLILVPCGLFQGYVDGWPLALYAVYYAFFCIGAIVRLRLYGDLSSREQDKQWATKTSRLAQVSFVAAVVGGHWLAAREARQLAQNVPATNAAAWLLLAAAIIVHWKATFYLGRYFDRLVVPKEVVVFGPYRWVRHPIYTSYMLLFAGYCAALRSYWSLALMLVASLAYYHQRVRLEEDLLVQNFGKDYTDYRERVKQKFIPFIY